MSFADQIAYWCEYCDLAGAKWLEFLHCMIKLCVTKSTIILYVAIWYDQIGILGVWVHMHYLASCTCFMTQFHKLAEYAVAIGAYMKRQNTLDHTLVDH